MRKRRLLLIDNPIDLLERREVQEYADAQPLSRERVKQVVDAIDRSVLAGKRDYALLLLFLSTGRRASEVLSLQLKHIEPVEDTAILHFEHCKGGKGMYDKLERRVWRALYDYLHSAWMTQMTTKDPEQHLWLSFSMKHFKQPLTQRGLADIFQKHLGTMKIHTTRHTFAHSMKKIGADVTDIQYRLGHSWRRAHKKDFWQVPIFPQCTEEVGMYHPYEINRQILDYIASFRVSVVTVFWLLICVVGEK